MSKYSSPFNERTFFERYSAAFEFQKHNFKSLSVLYILFVMPMSFLIAVNNVEVVELLLTLVVETGILAFYFTIFKQYMKREGTAHLDKVFFNDFISVLPLSFAVSVIFDLAIFIVVMILAFIHILYVEFGYVSNDEFAVAILFVFIIIMATLYVLISLIHCILSTDIVLTKRIRHGFMLQKGHRAGILCYGLFCGFVCALLMVIVFVLSIFFGLLIHGKGYEPGNIFSTFLIFSGCFLCASFLLVPLLYQYTHIIAQDAAMDGEDEMAELS